jgi:Cu(I)/Ag(I) efflux system membrane protein CusA/SilA
MKPSLTLSLLMASTTGAALAQTAFAPAKAPLAVAAPAKMPLVNGEVRRFDPATGLIVLRHGDIPNLAMPAMVMGFDVADRKMLQGLKVGDKVRFQAEMIQGKATVTVLQLVK